MTAAAFCVFDSYLRIVCRRTSARWSGVDNGRQRVASLALARRCWSRPDTTLCTMQSVIAKVKSPSSVDVLTRTLDAEGRFAFTSDEAGEHLVCFQIDGEFFGTPTEVVSCMRSRACRRHLYWLTKRRDPPTTTAH